MHFQFDVTPVTPLPASEPIPATVAEGVDLLRQILEVQREQLNYLRATTAAHDMGGRWRAFLTRWQEEFPELSQGCRKALPAIERAYGKLIADLTEMLCQDGNDALDNDFALQEFLDRYGMRLAQLGTILNLVGPLADAGSQGESQGEAT
jgi:hypothetical protein